MTIEDLALMINRTMASKEDLKGLATKEDMKHTTYMPLKRKSAARGYIYRITVEPDADRYYAEVPALPGCYSWGYTYEEAIKNIKEAAALWLEMLAEEGKPIPQEDLQVLRQALYTLCNTGCLTSFRGGFQFANLCRL